jgi:hypothetical protein
MFAQRYRMIKNAQRNVEDVHVEFIDVIDLDFKNYYIVFTLKISVRMKFDTRYVALLNTKAEINIIIEEMMHKENLFMRRVVVGLGFEQKFPPNPWVWVRSGWVFK